MPDFNFTVRAWMSSSPPTISPKENLKRARALMRKAKVFDLFVVDDGKLVGTLSERDIWEHCPTSAVLLDEHQAETLLEHIRVGGVMTLHPPTVTPEMSLCEAARIFAQGKSQGLPVVENSVPVGLLSQDNLIQAAAMILKDVNQDMTPKSEGHS